ncbi:MAG: hypothetical protein H7A33_06065 [Deltaproteobacteria bacterium]|nr:hypothetical protein [Deltaproteobacteria bacterium]
MSKNQPPHALAFSERLPRFKQTWLEAQYLETDWHANLIDNTAFPIRSHLYSALGLFSLNLSLFGFSFGSDPVLTFLLGCCSLAGFQLSALIQPKIIPETNDVKMLVKRFLKYGFPVQVAMILANLICLYGVDKIVVHQGMTHVNSALLALILLPSIATSLGAHFSAEIFYRLYYFSSMISSISHLNERARNYDYDKFFKNAGINKAKLLENIKKDLLRVESQFVALLDTHRQCREWVDQSQDWFDHLKNHPDYTNFYYIEMELPLSHFDPSSSQRESIENMLTRLQHLTERCDKFLERLKEDYRAELTLNEFIQELIVLLSDAGTAEEKFRTEVSDFVETIQNLDRLRTQIKVTMG